MNQEDIIIDGYTIVSRLGGGGFGEVFLGRVNSTGREVAIKVEKIGLKEPQLRHEYKVYRELEKKSIVNPRGFCQAEKYDHTGRYNYMIIDLLGNSLSDLFRNKCSKRFSLKTVLQIADQIFERIQAFHDVHLIHRDISSGNFVVGRDDPDTIYFIDFGMSTRYRDPHTLKHNPERQAASRRGTTRYASINNLLGRQQSRRDDLESIAYIIIRFLRRELPWEHISAAHYDKPHRVVREMKINTPIETLCEGMPAVFGAFLKYARGLKFAEDPDISLWREKFRKVYVEHGYDKEPFSWDWTNIPTRPKRGASVLTEPLVIAPVLVASTDAVPLPSPGNGRLSPSRMLLEVDRTDAELTGARSELPAVPLAPTSLKKLGSPSPPVVVSPPTAPSLPQKVASEDTQGSADTLMLHLPAKLPSPLRRLSKAALESQTRALTEGHEQALLAAQSPEKSSLQGMQGMQGLHGMHAVGEVMDCTSCRDDTTNTSNCERYSPSLAGSRERTMYTPLDPFAASFESCTTANDGPYLHVTAVPSPLNAQNRSFHSFNSFNSSLNNSAFSATTAPALSCACGTEESGASAGVDGDVLSRKEADWVMLREGGKDDDGGGKGVKEVELEAEGVDSAKSDTTKVTVYPVTAMLR